MSIETTNVVRQKRPKGFYISDNELVDHFAAGIGIYAFGVYHLLMREAEDRDGARISQRKIQELLGISTDSARNAIATLKNAGLVEEVPSERPDGAPMYLISYAKDVLAERRAAGKGCPEFGTRVKTKRAQNGVRKSGPAATEIQDEGARNFGQERAEFRTPDIEVNQTKLLEQNNTPLAPASGGGMRLVSAAGRENVAQKLEYENPEAEYDNRPDEADAAKPGDGKKRAVVGGAVETLEAAHEVMRECGFAKNARLTGAIGDALQARVALMECELEEAKTLAIENVKTFKAEAHLMRYTWSWTRFFRDAYWMTPNLWPYDEKKCERQRRRL